MDRARHAVDGDDVAIDGIDPLAEEFRHSVLLLVGALGLIGLVAVVLLMLTTGSGGAA